MTSFRVKPGEKITVDIQGDKPAVLPKETEAPKYIGVEPAEDPLYVFRKQTGATLYDLGMVLNESGEYEEIKDALLFSIEPATGNYQQTDLDIENFGTMLQGKYLANDPTGFTGDKPNRKPLPFDSHKLMIDVHQFDAENNETKTIVGKRERAYLTDIFSEDDTPPIPDTNPNWLSGGSLKTVAGLTHLVVQNAAYFLDLYTYQDGGDWFQNFKITSEPSFAADAVVPDLSGLQGIYLVPAPNYNLIIYTLGSSEFGQWGAQSYQRLSPYEGYDFPLTPYSSILPAPTKAAFTDKMVDSGIYAKALEGEAERRTILGAVGPDIEGRMQVGTVGDISGFLADEGGDQLTIIRFRGVLKTTENVYYVWNPETFATQVGGWLMADAGFTHGVVSE